MVKIIRYSLTGWKAQYQNYHLEDVHYHMYNFDLNEFPLHSQRFIKAKHDKLVPFYKQNYFDLQYGVWAFIDGHKNNQSLNHLKRHVPCWKAEISDDAIVYDVNWENRMAITNDKCKIFGFYIPKKELHKLLDSYKKEVVI